MENRTNDAGWLRVHLLRKNIRSAALAERIGVTRSTVSQWLSGKKSPSSDSMEKIAKATEVSVSELQSMVKSQAASKQRNNKRINAYKEVIRELIDAIVRHKQPAAIIVDYAEDKRAEVKWTIKTLSLAQSEFGKSRRSQSDATGAKNTPTKCMTWLRKLAFKKNMSAAMLAKKIGTSRAMISQWMCEKKAPSDDSLQRIAKATGTPIVKLHIMARSRIISRNLPQRIAESYEEIIRELVIILVARTPPDEFPRQFKAEMSAKAKWIIDTLISAHERHYWSARDDQVSESIDRDIERYLIEQNLDEIVALKQSKAAKTSPAQRRSAKRSATTRVKVVKSAKSQKPKPNSTIWPTTGNKAI